MTLRTLNTAQSAFVVFTLRCDFFRSYTMRAGASASVKLFLRNVVSIFRVTHGVDKAWIQIKTGAPEGGGDDDAYMKIQLECNSGLRKRFDLSFQEVRVGGEGGSPPRPPAPRPGRRPPFLPSSPLSPLSSPSPSLAPSPPPPPPSPLLDLGRSPP